AGAARPGRGRGEAPRRDLGRAQVPAESRLARGGRGSARDLSPLARPQRRSPSRGRTDEPAAGDHGPRTAARGGDPGPRWLPRAARGRRGGLRGHPPGAGGGAGGTRRSLNGRRGTMKRNSLRAGWLAILLAASTGCAAPRILGKATLASEQGAAAPAASAV